MNFTLNGIQRSGTNYTYQYLKKLGLSPVNSGEVERNDPRHKHFRWYSNKFDIPFFIERHYGNSVSVSCVDQINLICSYPRETIQIVVIKNYRSWLVSILKWGIICKWFGSVDESLEFVPELTRDYVSYYMFWGEMKYKDPEKVFIVDLDFITKKPSDFNKLISRLMGSPLSDFDGVIPEVPMSPPSRNDRYSDEDISKMKEASRLFFNLNEYLIQGQKGPYTFDV